MSIDDKLAQILALTEQVRSELNSKVLLKPGDNLLSMLEAASANATFLLPWNYYFDWDEYQITKPVTIAYSENLPIGRINFSESLPVLLGAVEIKAPDVNLSKIRLIGKRKDSIIVTTGEKTVINRCLVVGSATGQKAGISANSANVTVVDSKVTGIYHIQDAQAIRGWTGAKNLLVHNCYLESSGEIVIFGGADPENESLTPQDIAITNCDLIRPISWRGRTDMTVKNLFELKNAKRVRVENCTMENNWVNGQVGYAIVVTVRNQDGKAPFSTIEDVVFRNISVKHSACGISILGNDYTHPSQTIKRILFDNMKFEDIDPVAWGEGGSSYQIQVSRGSEDLSFNNLSFSGKNLSGAFSFGDNLSLLNNRFNVTNCTFEEGDYGIHGAGSPSLGKAVLDQYCPNYIWQNVIIKRGTSGRNINYPTGTTIV